MEVDGCPLPEDRWYDLENDVWLKPDGDGRFATLGLMAPLAAFAGKFLAVGFRPVQGVVARGRSVATVESVRYTGPVRMPMDGRVAERNEALPKRPKLLNDSPYDLGWVVRVELDAPADVTRSLRSAADARTAVGAKIREWRVHCYPAAPDQELIEVGAECAAILARLDEVLEERPAGDVTLLVTDDPTSPIEMVRWADRSGHTVLHHRREGNLHHFLVRREAHPVPRARGADGRSRPG